MVMDKVELDALVLASKVIGRAGGMGIHVAGFDVEGDVVKYNGEVVEAPKAKAAVVK
jgi:hypothetical protein